LPPHEKTIQPKQLKWHSLPKGTDARSTAERGLVLDLLEELQRLNKPQIEVKIQPAGAAKKRDPITRRKSLQTAEV
jgi:hypothetical protein